MANPNNCLNEWNLNVKFELNHEKGLCVMNVYEGENLLKSMKFIQGYHVDEAGKLMNEEDTEAMKWLLRLLDVKQIDKG